MKDTIKQAITELRKEVKFTDTLNDEALIIWCLDHAIFDKECVEEFLDPDS
tara:strand:- start:323 stop:475 length:153 start_codon:yes stop_codon:yes gene_type:complete